MKKNIRIIGFIITIILASIWGWNQSRFFPYETYGHLSILTSIIGGAVIGFSIANLTILIENKFK